MHEHSPESAVAYDESFVMQLLEKYGLAVEQRIYGRWSGREGGLSYQDILILSHKKHKEEHKKLKIVFCAFVFCLVLLVNPSGADDGGTTSPKSAWLHRAVCPPPFPNAQTATKKVQDFPPRRSCSKSFFFRSKPQR